MLATLTDFKQKITLIRDSGIQFLDFALKPVWDDGLPAKFVRAAFSVSGTVRSKAVNLRSSADDRGQSKAHRSMFGSAEGPSCPGTSL